VRFGDVCFDGDSRQLYRQNEPVHLSGKAFALLKLLLERRPSALSKAELQEHLWPDTFVSEANLPTLVAEIREAIGDDARRPRFVRTVHRFGYAFSGSVIDDRQLGDAQSSRCWLISDLGRFPMIEGDTVLGRDEDSGIVLDSTTVSRHHAQISVRNGVASIADLESKNGTYVSGERVVNGRLLVEGDQIRVGSFLLTFHQAAPSASTSTESPAQDEARSVDGTSPTQDR
jgi:DNA-binding winged helix-turn-helix (wHTH) protein